MKPVSRFSATLISALTVLVIATPVVLGNKGPLATITGSVKDSKGNPLAGALITLIKDGAAQISKQTRSGPDGRFSAKILPGRYGIRAIAQGFNEVVFSAVEVRASQELIYRFNLEPAGAGRTLPEGRRDREDVRWRLRAAQGQKSIFQIQEGQDETIKAITAAEADANGEDLSATETADAGAGASAKDAGKRTRTQGVIETYFASNGGSGPGTIGMNFALAMPASDRVDLIFAGQVGNNSGASQRFEATALVRAGDRHRITMSAGAMQLGNSLPPNKRADDLGQLSVRAIDEWVVRDGVVIVVGLDYSRFVGARGGRSLTPRLGVQYDVNARTRVKAAYAPGGDETNTQSVAEFENHQVVFNGATAQPVALVGGRALMSRSRRFEVGVERVLDNDSSVETTAFFDTTSGRGVGLLSMPLSAFSGTAGDALMNIANQEGTARGTRVVYTRRLGHVWTASAGYSFGRGQRLSAHHIASPADVFSNAFFQTAALQIGAGFGRGTHVRTVFRFSSDATVFAIDPFAGRLGVYDPSLSIQVTQDLPTFGLPLKAEAVIDARNLLDAQPSADSGETFTQMSTLRRSVRGGISVRF